MNQTSLLIYDLTVEKARWAEDTTARYQATIPIVLVKLKRVILRLGDTLESYDVSGGVSI